MRTAARAIGGGEGEGAGDMEGGAATSRVAASTASASLRSRASARVKRGCVGGLLSNGLADCRQVELRLR